MLADARAGDEVERPRPESVRRTGEGAHRADLDGVAGEVRVEGFVGVDADLLQRTAIRQFDERIAGDLCGEPRAPGAQYASLPVELFKAARVDGAGFWRIFFMIMVPMSVPITIVAVILQVTGIWNDFLFGVVFAGRSNWPMTVQLNNIVNSTTGVREYNINMAATILTAAVPLAVYFISGRWFVRGIAAGAVKG